MRLGSVQLGYAVNLREAALPEFSFNSWDYNPSAALSAAADNEVRKMAVDMITVRTCCCICEGRSFTRLPYS